jgi:hypothetical protein
MDDTGQPPDTPDDRSPRCRLEAERAAQAGLADALATDELEQSAQPQKLASRLASAFDDGSALRVPFAAEAPLPLPLRVQLPRLNRSVLRFARQPM